MQKYIVLFILLFPMATWLLLYFVKPLGLIWLFMDTLYYYPGYILASSLFLRAEMGLLVPSLGGRIFTFLLYGIILFLIFRLKHKFK